MPARRGKKKAKVLKFTKAARPECTLCGPPVKVGEKVIQSVSILFLIKTPPPPSPPQMLKPKVDESIDCEVCNSKELSIYWLCSDDHVHCEQCVKLAV